MSRAKNTAADAVDQTANQSRPEALAQEPAAISPEPDAQATTEQITEQSVRLRVAAPAGLNLREGPHKSYAVLAVLPEGSVVTVLNLPEDAEVPRWALVASEVGIGWVADNFLLPEV